MLDVEFSLLYFSLQGTELERTMSTTAKRFHGHYKGKRPSPTYHSWSSMLQRCTNPNRAKWATYGGRGIKVCERWTSFANFLADMGERPTSKTLDRINNDGNYEPGNCRWATAAQQRANSRMQPPPIKPRIEMAGQRYGRLTVVNFSHRGPKRESFWNCHCDCGRDHVVNRKGLTNGNTKSCGCLKRDVLKLPRGARS